MEFMVHLLLCFVLTIDYFLGISAELHPSYLQSKIFYGKPANEGDHTYMASLQLGCKHVCSSALFQEGFLLTTGICAEHMYIGMTKDNETGTAVLGNVNLKKGRRIIILEIAYPDIKASYASVGVIMIGEGVDYTQTKTLDLYPRSVAIRYQGKNASLCGWGTVKERDQIKYSIGNAQYAEDLHCLILNIGTTDFCTRSVGNGNFKTKLLCGVTRVSKQTTTMGDVGSPVVKKLYENGEEKKYIIGVTVPRNNYGKDQFIQFIRASYVLPSIKEMVENLQSDHALHDTESDSSSGKDLPYGSNKRPKLGKS